MNEPNLLLHKLPELMENELREYDNRYYQQTRPAQNFFTAGR